MQSQSKNTARKAPRGELDIISQIRGWAGPAGAGLNGAGLNGTGKAGAGKIAAGRLRLGIGDDCALLRPRAGEEFAVTTDLTIAGIHYRMDWHTPESAGHRTLARGMSDLAAMGAQPVAAFFS